VLALASSEKLLRLEGGDFEESDAELDAFLAELKKVKTIPIYVNKTQRITLLGNVQSA
jgi:hypothetical protein